MNRKELLSIPKRKWDEELKDVAGVYVIPSRRKHDSGWACMDFVAEFSDDRPMVRFGGGCDDVSFFGSNFRMDCLYPHGIIHIWNRKGFTVSHDISSIDFVETPMTVIERTRNKEDVENAPTIEERKKGEWLPDKFGFWVCSSCKFPSEASAANLLYKYCPVCGADMRGEAK